MGPLNSSEIYQSAGVTSPLEIFTIQEESSNHNKVILQEGENNEGNEDNLRKYPEFKLGRLQ